MVLTLYISVPGTQLRCGALDLTKDRTRIPAEETHDPARREGAPIQGQPEARGSARLEDRRRRRRQGAGGARRRRHDRQPHHRQRRRGDRRDQPPLRWSRRATWHSAIRARTPPRCSACRRQARQSRMGRLGERHRGARARHARHVPRRRLLASRRQHPADPRGGADHGEIRPRPDPRHRHRLRDPHRPRARDLACTSTRSTTSPISAPARPPASARCSA